MKCLKIFCGICCLLPIVPHSKKVMWRNSEDIKGNFTSHFTNCMMNDIPSVSDRMSHLLVSKYLHRKYVSVCTFPTHRLLPSAKCVFFDFESPYYKLRQTTNKMLDHYCITIKALSMIDIWYLLLQILKVKEDLTVKGRSIQDTYIRTPL